jgi:type I restriction enzyme S subunit
MSDWQIDEYPSEWNEERLGDCVLIDPESLGASTPEDYEFRYIDISSVERGTVTWSEVELHEYASAPNRAKRVVQKGDVLLSTVRPSLQGHVFANWSTREPLICSTGFAVLRSSNRIVPEFLHHLVFSNIVDRQLRQRITGSNYPAVRSSDVRAVRIPLPPLSVQRRIAEVLDTVDAAIQQTDAVIAKQQQVKTGLLQDLLTRGLDEQGRLRDPERHTEQFKDSPLGRIPKAWEVESVGSLSIHVSSGSTPKGGKKVYQNEGVQFIRSQNVWPSGLDLDDVAHIPREIHRGMRRTHIRSNDVLLNITGASIGRCCVAPASLGEANVNQHVCIIRLSEPTPQDASYLANVIASPVGQSQIARLQAGGSREGLNYGQVRSFNIPWPEKNERARISQTIQSLERQLDDELAYRGKLQRLKAGLMQDLLTGAVRVPEAEAAVQEVVA